MTANKKILYPELSYKLVGICFAVQNELGCYAREKQYGDRIEEKLRGDKTTYKREFPISETGNVLDFLVEEKIALEIKAKRVLIKEDYYQLQRYLQESHMDLGILVNFRDRYLKPRRILRIVTK